MLNIVRGKQKIAPKVMLYSLPGAGKSTLASTLPNALFLDIEGGLSFLDVARVPISSADELMQVLLELGKQAKMKKREFDYIVIDSVDWLVNLFGCKVSGAGQGSTVEALMQSATLTINKAQGGYGNGKQVLENYIRNTLVPFLNKLNRMGYGIVLIAHADKKTMLDADGDTIDRLAPKMDINSMNVFIEWVDNMFYLRKDEDESRHLILDSTDNITAKNRIGLKGQVNVKGLNLDALITGKAQSAGQSNKE